MWNMESRRDSGSAGRGGVWYLCILAGAAVFYLWLRQAPADQPRFLLEPISALTGLLSGVTFVFQPGLGYGGMTRDGIPVRIVGACAGGNFLIMTYVLLMLTQLGRLRTGTAKAALCAGGLLFSYAGAVAASALRVSATVLLTGAGLSLSWDLMHNIVGIATYAAMTCMCYLAARRLVGLLPPGKVENSYV